MRSRAVAVLLAACLLATADDTTTVNSVVATVRTAIRKKHKDAELAASLQKVSLGERLEDRVIEILESEGAGPQSLGALQHLRDVSRQLPLPAAPPPGMEQPPPPSADEEYRVWQSTRAKAIDYTRSLPDFICTETIHRWSDPTGQEAWKPDPTLVIDLTFFEQRERYQLLTVDGRKSDKSILEVGGAYSQGEFGSMLRIIFDLRSGTEYQWDHWTTLRKRPTWVFSFYIAAARATDHLIAHDPENKNGQVAAVAQRGYVYIDRESGNVTRIASRADDIPADFPIQKSSRVLDYGYSDVGGRSFLLPLRAEIRIDTGNVQSLNSVSFDAYRKFSSSTSVTFGGR